MRRRPIMTPFVLTIRKNNTEKIHATNPAASSQGLALGMGLADARASCPQLTSEPCDTEAEERFLLGLCRWARRYCPWVGVDGVDGLLMDITGSTHLWGGEAAFVRDIKTRLERSGLSAFVGVADTRGAAWALSHFHPSIAPVGQSPRVIEALPLAALRLERKTLVSLERLGLRKIADIKNIPRAQLTRRLGDELLMRLDQALGVYGESIAPIAEPDYFAVRMNIPDPIGLLEDVMAALARVMDPLCVKMDAHGQGMLALLMTIRRVDNSRENIRLRFARLMRHGDQILPLLYRHVDELDAGFGIDQIRVEAQEMAAVSTEGHGMQDTAFSDLITRIGNRVGFENITRIHERDTYLPDRSFVHRSITQPTAQQCTGRDARPLIMFLPEAISARHPSIHPPKIFRWRRMSFQTARATGPERIAPEWWREDDDWRAGVRDYWRVSTTQGRRLWLFYTPQNPNWYVHGEFS